MTKHIQHIRHHAKKHHEEHLNLKKLLALPIFKGSVWDIFIGTFLITITTIIIFLNWGNITSFFSGDEEMKPADQEELLVHGFQSSTLATYKISDQALSENMKLLSKIDSDGSLSGAIVVDQVDKQMSGTERTSMNALNAAIFVSTDLGKGQHLTRLKQSQARLLQKSIISTFYLGEKTIDIDSTLQLDTKILSQISNALSIDLFQYLNQATVRADALDNYLDLLTILQERAIQRVGDLESKINFLNANFFSQEQRIQFSESAFFENLKIFDGPNAEQELAEFIGVQKEQSEVRAKIGAYEGLKSYYEFFIPRLENLITAIRANRGPLIAGVKVVEIQNMTLPLIIREN